MAKFTLRVELIDPVNVDYPALATEMWNEGFSQRVRAVDGSLHQLPAGEYIIEGAYTNEQVMEKAKKAAGKVRSDFAILVTRAGRRTWHNLEGLAPRPADVVPPPPLPNRALVLADSDSETKATRRRRKLARSIGAFRSKVRGYLLGEDLTPDDSHD